MRSHAYAFARKQLQGHAARKGIGQGEAAAVMSAAAQVVKTGAAHPGGVVGVAGARSVGKKAVVRAVGVGVIEQGGQRLAGGSAVLEATHDARQVAFAPGGSDGAAARGAALQKGAERVHIEGKSGGQAVERHADGGTVAFAEDLHGKHASDAAAHLAIPPN